MAVVRLSDFQRQHPDIQVRLSATSTVEQIGGRDIDLGIRFGRGKWDGLESELLARNHIFPVCAPACSRPTSRSTSRATCSTTRC